MHFFDASALTKQYVEEAGSDLARHLIATSDVAVSRLSAVEVPSALHRMRREERFSEEQCALMIDTMVDAFGHWRIVDLGPEVVAVARQVLARHALRAGDAVQLATAVVLERQVDRSLDAFVVFDHRLAAAARAENLNVIGVE